MSYYSKWLRVNSGVVSAVLIASCLGLSSTPVMSQTALVEAFLSSGNPAAPSSQFTLGVRITNNNTTVGSYAFELLFDNSLLSFVSIQDGGDGMGVAPGTAQTANGRSASASNITSTLQNGTLFNIVLQTAASLPATYEVGLIGLGSTPLVATTFQSIAHTYGPVLQFGEPVGPTDTPDAQATDTPTATHTPTIDAPPATATNTATHTPTPGDVQPTNTPASAYIELFLHSGNPAAPGSQIEIGARLANNTQGTVGSYALEIAFDSSVLTYVSARDGAAGFGAEPGTGTSVNGRTFSGSNFTSTLQNGVLFIMVAQTAGTLPSSYQVSVAGFGNTPLVATTFQSIAHVYGPPLEFGGPVVPTNTPDPAATDTPTATHTATHTSTPGDVQPTNTPASAYIELFLHSGNPAAPGSQIEIGARLANNTQGTVGSYALEVAFDSSVLTYVSARDGAAGFGAEPGTGTSVNGRTFSGSNFTSTLQNGVLFIMVAQTAGTLPSSYQVSVAGFGSTPLVATTFQSIAHVYGPPLELGGTVVPTNTPDPAATDTPTATHTPTIDAPPATATHTSTPGDPTGVIVDLYLHAGDPSAPNTQIEVGCRVSGMTEGFVASYGLEVLFDTGVLTFVSVGDAGDGFGAQPGVNTTVDGVSVSGSNINSALQNGTLFIVVFETAASLPSSYQVSVRNFGPTPLVNNSFGEIAHGYGPPLNLGVPPTPTNTPDPDATSTPTPTFTATSEPATATPTHTVTNTPPDTQPTNTPASAYIEIYLHSGNPAAPNSQIEIGARLANNTQGTVGSYALEIAFDSSVLTYVSARDGAAGFGAEPGTGTSVNGRTFSGSNFTSTLQNGVLFIMVAQTAGTLPSSYQVSVTGFGSTPLVATTFQSIAHVYGPPLELGVAPVPTDTPMATATETPISVPTDTPTSIPTDTPTNSPTATATATATQTAVIVPTDTPTSTPTATATVTDTPTSVPTATETPMDDATPTPTETPMDDATPTATETPVDEATPTATETPVDEATPTVTETPVDDATPTPSGTPVDVATPTPTFEFNADINRDGKVDHLDLLLLLEAWHQTF